MKRFLKATSVILVTILFFSLALPVMANENKPVKVGFLYPLSGTNADSGAEDKDAAEFAVKNWNEAGGVLNGRKIELVIVDSTSDPTQTKAAAERLLAEGVSAIVGCGISSLTIPIMSSVEKAEVPLITICMSPELTESGYQYIFQAAPLTAANGKCVVDFLNYLNAEDGLNLGIKNVASVYENSAWGIGNAKGLVENAGKVGLEVVYDESFPAGFTDASSIVTSMKAVNADVVFITAYTQEAKLIVSTMEALDYHPLIIGGGGGFLWKDFGIALGDDVNGIISVGTSNWATNFSKYSPGGYEKLTKLAKEYEEVYGYYMTEHSVPTYNCYDVLFRAIDIAGTDDPKAVAQALRNTEFTDCIIQNGTVDFDEQGKNIYSYSVMSQWINNKPVCVFPVDVAAHDLVLTDSLKKK